MGNKKEIGRFFKERMTEKKSQPTDLVWDTILLTLEKKRRYRFFVILLGILLSISIGILTYWATTSHTETTIFRTSIQENQDSKTTQQSEKKTTVPPSIKNTSNNEKEIRIKTKDLQQSPSIGFIAPRTSTSSSSSESTPFKLATKLGVHINYKTSVLKTQKKKELDSTIKKQQPSYRQHQSYNKSIPKQSNKTKNESEKTKSEKHRMAISIPDTKSAIRNTPKADSIKSKDNNNVNNALKETQIGSTPNTHQNTTRPERDSNTTKKDSIKVKPTKKSKKDKKKEGKKEKELLEEVLDKASFAIHVGPTHFGNLSRNYPIFLDETNRKSINDIGFVYGVSINAHISPKVTLSAGLNMLNFKYTVKNVEGGINTFGRPAIINNSTTRFLPILLSEIEINTLNNESDFSLKHKVSYAEVPIELAFKLNTRKLDIHLLGGLDVFFLKKNTLSLKSNNIGSIDIGTANYLKEVSFGSHIGVNVKHVLTDHIQVYVKPLFKYQFGASENIQGFRPYYFGILTGLEFKLN